MADRTTTFSISTDSPWAVYQQIQNQIQFAIASGALKPGDTLPSVREMSETLNINPNTVTKAYHELEVMKLLVTRRGVGVHVASDAARRCRDRIRKLSVQELRDAVAACRCSGVNPATVAAEVDKMLKSDAPPYGARK